MRLLDKIAVHARDNPSYPALTGLTDALDYGSLMDEVNQVTTCLKEQGVQVIGLDADNTPSWVVIDLAALNANVCLVPLPPFFSGQQLQHAMQQAGIEAIFTDNPDKLLARTGNLNTSGSESLLVAGKKLSLIRTGLTPMPLPDDVVKVTYTSGTTGEPKGVMLTAGQIQTVVDSLSDAVKAVPADRHLPLMPLAVLLENLAGVYVSLFAGANTVLPGLAAVGLTGSVGMNATSMLAIIETCKPSTLIMTPQLLQTLIEVSAGQARALESLRFIALGGAPVSGSLLDKAEALKMPVYEGYGLSECASVTTLNTPQAHRKGSVGKPLPHINLTISENGEVLINEHEFSGYLGQPNELSGSVWHTGDLGYLDRDGYLFLTGRKRNVFITSMGRNVSPEWVERELLMVPEIMQVAVFGEALPRNTAVVMLAQDSDESLVWDAIETVNKQLPDYARVSHLVIADEPFTPMNKQLSGTGRNRREAIYRAYETRISKYYIQENIS